MSLDLDQAARELDGLLDAISYEVTSARAAGLKRPEDLRAALKKTRELVADADSLASHLTKQEPNDD